MKLQLVETDNHFMMVDQKGKYKFHLSKDSGTTPSEWRDNILENSMIPVELVEYFEVEDIYNPAMQDYETGEILQTREQLALPSAHYISSEDLLNALEDMDFSNWKIQDILPDVPYQEPEQALLERCQLEQHREQSMLRFHLTREQFGQYIKDYCEAQYEKMEQKYGHLKTETVDAEEEHPILIKNNNNMKTTLLNIADKVAIGITTPLTLSGELLGSGFIYAGSALLKFSEQGYKAEANLRNKINYTDKSVAELRAAAFNRNATIIMAPVNLIGRFVPKKKSVADLK
jgi:hypothetical protein